MAKQPSGFNFTFGASTPTVQPQQQQPPNIGGQLQVPSFTFGATAVKAPSTSALQFGTGAAITSTGTGPTFGLSTPAAPPSNATATATSTQPGFGFAGFGMPTTPAAPSAAATAPVIGTTASTAAPPALGMTFTAPTPAAPALTVPNITATSTTSASPFTIAPLQQPVATATTAPSHSAALTLSTQPPATISAPPIASSIASTTATAAPAATATITGTAAGPKATMKFGELEQLVATRRAELEQAGRAFIQLAAVLANRDADLRRSAVKLVGAEAELDRLRMTAETLDRELDYADTQTAELENVVDDIERQLVGVSGGSTAADLLRQPQPSLAISGSTGGDRSTTLQMAVAVDAQLRASARQLRSLSERVNSITGAAALTGLGQRGDSSAGAAGTGSGTATVTRLLDSQLRLLEWAESTSSQLQRRIDALSNRAGNTSVAFGYSQTLAD